jgi:8-oxo-dGTP diphosphatase
MERFKMIASGYAMFIRKDTILLACRKNTGYMDGFYSLPAGHIEDGESITRGTCREIQEETGVRVNIKEMQLVHVMHRRSDDIRMDFFFLIKKYSQNPVNAELEKCSSMEWFPIDALPNNTIPYIKEAISNVRNSVFFSEFGWK